MNSKPSLRQRLAGSRTKQPVPPQSALALTPEKLASPELPKFDVAHDDPLTAWKALDAGVDPTDGPATDR